MIPGDPTPIAVPTQPQPIAPQPDTLPSVNSAFSSNSPVFSQAPNTPFNPHECYTNRFPVNLPIVNYSQQTFQAPRLTRTSSIRDQPQAPKPGAYIHESAPTLQSPIRLDNNNFGYSMASASHLPYDPPQFAPSQCYMPTATRNTPMHIVYYMTICATVQTNT